MSNLNQQGNIKLLPILFIIVAIGIISFLLISSTLPFKGIYNSLFPKQLSQAATSFETPPPNARNVKNYGALGDGVHDDAPNIQQAINSTLSGGAVYIPTGTYMLGTTAGGVENYPDGSLIQSALIINKDNVTLMGDGNGTVLKLMPSKKMRIISITSKNDTLEQFLADGNKANRNGAGPYPSGDVVDVLVYGNSTSSFLTVRNCETKNGIEDGIGFWQSSNGTVDSCFSHDNGTPQAGAVGIAISGNQNTGGKIMNSTISNNSSAGIWLNGSSNTIIQNNTIENNTGSAISIGGDSLASTILSTGHQILNNTVRGNGSGGFAAVSILSSQNGVISQNTVVDNSYFGISFDDNSKYATSGWSVTNNNCSNTNSNRIQQRGIKVAGALTNNITLTGNTCKDNGTSLAHQIEVLTANSVNSDWQTTNTLSFNASVCSLGLLGDIDCDNDIDIFDYSTVVQNFGQTGANLIGDFDKDGDIDLFDYSTLVTNFGRVN